MGFSIISMLERQKYELFRSELLKARVSTGARQVDVANVIGKPQSYVSKIESGERSIDVIEFINYCEAIKVDPVKFIKELINKI